MNKTSHICIIIWDWSATKRLPQYMKGVYMVIYDIVNEMAHEDLKSQGWDTLNYARQAVRKIIIHIFEETNIAAAFFIIISLGGDYLICFACVVGGLY